MKLHSSTSRAYRCKRSCETRSERSRWGSEGRTLASHAGGEGDVECYFAHTRSLAAATRHSQKCVRFLFLRSHRNVTRTQMWLVILGVCGVGTSSSQMPHVGTVPAPSSMELRAKRGLTATQTLHTAPASPAPGPAKRLGRLESPFLAQFHIGWQLLHNIHWLL